MAAKSTKFSAPGKVILFGEHSVVYGHPAIASAIGLRAWSEVKESTDNRASITTPMLFSDEKFFISRNLNVPQEIEPFKHIFLKLSEIKKNNLVPEIEISSNIPHSAGLGSSAATAVSLAASLLEFYGYEHKLDEINKIAFESEIITHGTPSGIDNSISTYGGGILYEKGVMKNLNAKISTSTLLVVDSGVLRQTKEIVERVRKKKETDSGMVQTIFNNIEEITWRAKEKIESGDIEGVGNLMNENHGLLEKLGVSNSTLNNIVKFIDETDVLGRKLTGAGGGGCIIALYKNYENAKDVALKLGLNGFDTYLSHIFETGVKLEE